MIDSGIFESECIFKTSRSSGSGGQHVNKTESKVALWFDVAASSLFNDEEKQRIFGRLSAYITDGGCLQLSCDEQRSQRQNKVLVVARAVALIDKALVVAAPRKKTKPSRVAVEKRLEEKRRNALRKTERNRPHE